MHLINQNGKKKCIIYSLAMLLDMSPEDVERELPKISGRSHHMQEVIDYMLTLGKTMLCIEGNPCSELGAIYTPQAGTDRFTSYLAQGSGLIVCKYRHGGDLHCVAWDGNHMYDPNGRISEIDSPMYSIMKFYLMI